MVDRCVSLVETTSPSGLLSGSLDAARRQAAVHGGELLSENNETSWEDELETAGVYLIVIDNSKSDAEYKLIVQLR